MTTEPDDGRHPDPGPELTVVVPVYDEAATIESVVREVAAVADELAPGACEVLVVDDGSTDATPAIVDALAAELPGVEVVHQVNQGHGPALLVGFDRARGRWIGHLDSDDQIPAKELVALWAERAGADLVLGVRTGRDDPRHRLVLSAVVRRLVGLLAGRRIHDANVPCKLVTAELWAEARPLLPDGTFAPSIALALVAARRGRVLREVPVTHRARASGASSLRPLRLARAVVRAGAQTVALLPRLRRR
jgi:glycosyltransferase involved in cell wall biosynthesis